MNMGAKGTGEAPVCFEYFDEFEHLFGTKPNIIPVAIDFSSTASVTTNMILVIKVIGKTS